MNQNSITHASQIIKEGGVVAYPTEAVYGLGCDPMNEAAVMKLLSLKQRQVEKGLIIIAANVEQLEPYIDINQLDNYPELCQSWPGPHTWLVPCYDHVPRWVRGQHEKLAVRVTAHKLTSELCLNYGSAIISTSANTSTKAPALNVNEVEEQFANKLDYILVGETDGRDTVSTIRDADTGQQIR